MLQLHARLVSRLDTHRLFKRDSVYVGLRPVVDGEWRRKRKKPDLRRDGQTYLRWHGFARCSVCPIYEIAKGFGEGRQFPDDDGADALERCSDHRWNKSRTSQTPSRKQGRCGA